MTVAKFKDKWKLKGDKNPVPFFQKCDLPFMLK
jgi:hypothetical protein